MKIHILVAKGSYRHLEGGGQILSKRAFRTREAAERFAPKFAEIASADTDGITDLANANVSIVELELDESDLATEEDR